MPTTNRFFVHHIAIDGETSMDMQEFDTLDEAKGYANEFKIYSSGDTAAVIVEQLTQNWRSAAEIGVFCPRNSRAQLHCFKGSIGAVRLWIGDGGSDQFPEPLPL